MTAYIARRVLFLFPMLFVISAVVFWIIQLPPGDFMSTYIANLESSGIEVSDELATTLRRQYGLDRPITYQYFYWIRNIVTEGDWGRSFSWNKPVADILAERVPLTVAVSLTSTIFVFVMAIPIGIFSATNQYSLFDYSFTFLGFIGVSIPPFMLALILMWGMFTLFNWSVGGLFSPEYIDAPWSIARVLDLMSRIWFPVVLIGLSGTAGLMRVMRGNLLDELRKQYVVTARAKGIPEMRVLFYYPVKIAINPVISTIGWILPGIVAGEVLVSIVLNLQTTGPVLFDALLAQDMYLAGSITLILSMLVIFGNLIADLLLVWVDPRIRFGNVEE
ncbi:MAG: ABC transporter permease [Caldilineaceae bacterium SB0662_bin_9]|uniref:ABC transporter permease n=1 Tax=Caldilineaceae bacterium SB0662_bin_9 TaxID=2605258 RepID=A0A6B1DRG3_9CHLR|nr:ABC transporter permease [Caldilineaceae bacterium]MYD89446.1 ABC transporter permease [Caldilineaceae bacterium SB0662_bin_9]